MFNPFRVSIRVGYGPGLEHYGLQDRLQLGPIRLAWHDSLVAAGSRDGGVVLGVSGSHHDSAAVLMRDGRLLAALEEERLTRAKHDISQFPVNATLRLLSATGLRWRDIDHIAVGWDYYQFVATPHSVAPATRLFERLHAGYALNQGIRACDVRRRDVPERNFARFRPEAILDFMQTIQEEVGSEHTPRVSFVRHHLAHAASAWFASGFKEPTVVVSIDGYGETETTTVWLAKGTELRLLDSIQLPDSLGWVYSAITEFLGYQPREGEGVVMGLASYGVPRDLEEARFASELRVFMDEFVQLAPRGRFRVNSQYVYFGEFAPGRIHVSQTLIARLGKLMTPMPEMGRKIDPEAPADRKYAILAWALQQKAEETVVHVVRHFLCHDRRVRGVRCVALAGGVALNINANSRLLAEGLVTPGRLFVQPAAGDAGVALGAAMVVAREVYGADPRFKMRRTDLGPSYSDSDILVTLELHGLKPGEDYEVLENDDAIALRVAGMLVDNRVVAWFQGGSEFGPRALGNRSILLNPADPAANGIANVIKCREPWRPLAISIAVEEAARFLEGLPPEVEVPFMNVAFGIKSEKSTAVVSGLHRGDASSRPQTVARSQNPLLWRLLRCMGVLTGVPAVVNTSFNRGEPLVESPEEALNTFAYMKEVDALAIGRYLVTARKKIVPTIPCLREDPRTQSLLAVAMESNYLTAWESLFAAVQTCSRSALTITAVLRDKEGGERICEWPLVREFLSGESSLAIRRYVGCAICGEAVRSGAAQILIGSSGSKYDRIVFDALKCHLQTLGRLAEFEDLWDAARIGRLTDRDPAKKEPKCFVNG